MNKVTNGNPTQIGLVNNKTGKPIRLCKAWLKIVLKVNDFNAFWIALVIQSIILVFNDESELIVLPILVIRIGRPAKLTIVGRPKNNSPTNATGANNKRATSEFSPPVTASTIGLITCAMLLPIVKIEVAIRNGSVRMLTTGIKPRILEINESGLIKRLIIPRTPFLSAVVKLPIICPNKFPRALPKIRATGNPKK